MPTKAHQIMPARCKKATTLDKVLRSWTDPHDEYEIKEDGNRYLLQVRPNETKQNYLTSRRISVQTGEFVEKQDKLPHVREHIFTPPDMFNGAVFDGEWCVGTNSASAQSGIAKGKGHYVFWDLLYYQGKDIRDKSRSYRLSIIRKMLPHLPKWMTWRKGFFNLKAALEYVRLNNKEGLVRKTPNGKYGEGWTKATALHFHDVIIWGYYETKSEDWASKGWIGALRIGQWRALSRKTACSLTKYDSQEIPRVGQVRYINGTPYEFVDVGRCSGFTAKVRAMFSNHRERELGKVITIKCKERIEAKFRHPRFLGFHADKNAFECVYTPVV